MRWLLVFFLLFHHGISAAETSDKVGSILRITGTAYLVDNAKKDLKIPRLLREKEVIHVGDVIQTQMASLVNVQFDDQSRILLRENTRFAVQAFYYKADAEQTSEWRAFFEIFVGSFRTISGKIGKAPSTPEQYRVKTPVGLIGVRGTDYEVVLCDAGDCPAPNAQKSSENGVLLAVREGKIAVSLGEKTSFVNQGEYALAFANGQIQISTQPFANFVENPSPSPQFCQ